MNHTGRRSGRAPENARTTADRAVRPSVRGWFVGRVTAQLCASFTGWLNRGAVVLMSLIASHRDLDLDVLERLSAGAHSVGRTVAASGAAPTGAVVLATCNRFEVYLEVDRPEDAPGAVAATTEVIAHASGIPGRDVAANLQVLEGLAVPEHLF